MSVRNYTDQDLLNRVASLPMFEGFPPNYWLCCVRSDEDAYNKFDDKFYLFKGQQFVKVWKGTTNAGKFGLKSFHTYNSEGVALLKGDTIIYESHTRGSHKGKVLAYVQQKSFPYFRDNDRDNFHEEIGRERHGIIGANIHPASYIKGSRAERQFIEGWSIACMVFAVRSEFDDFMAITQGQRNLTLCILKEWNPPKPTGFSHFQNLRSEEIDLEIPVSTVEHARPIGNIQNSLPVTPVDMEPEMSPMEGDSDSASNSILNKIPILESAENTIGKVQETITEKIGDGEKQIEKTVSEVKNTFEPKNIPAFIPRFGKQWFLGLIPGAGFLSTVIAYINNAPQWLIFLFGALTGIALWNFFGLVIKHREKVLDFVIKCYEATSHPEMHNLIPTPAKGFFTNGARREGIIEAVNQTPVERLAAAWRELPASERAAFINKQKS
jgi:hypothetical protein